MTRKIIPLFLAVFIALSVSISSGCRMCGSSFDACVPAYLQRENDYRGCDPLYRSGSIFYGNADYSDTSGDLNCVDCSLTNAGMFGRTERIGKGKTPQTIRSMTQDRQNESNRKDLHVPTIEDLIKGKPTEEPEAPSPFGVPESIPYETPMPNTLPNSLPQPPQTIPFSTNDPKVTGGPQISVEELRRLDPDPNITDIRILNVDDVVDKAFQ